jgi:hypothetical protein
MKSMIKVLNQEKANQLAILGFKYVLETVNGESVCSFFMSEKIMDYINSNFDKKDFFLTNKITF